MDSIHDLKARTAQPGTLIWIGLAPQPQASITGVEEVEVRPGTGLVGDHHAQSGRSQRQVTLIQAEHLDVVASLLGRDHVRPEDIRRNLVIRGINLISLKDRRFRIGEVLLEGTGPCEPCSRMEANLGFGGYNAMRGHGGICARVLVGGVIRKGDPVEPVVDIPDEPPGESVDESSVPSSS